MNKFELEDTNITNDIKRVIDDSLIDYRNFQNNVAYQVNTELLKFYMSIGKRLYEDIENHSNIRGYKERLIQSFSKEYTERFGTGFSRSNIQNFIIFYKDYGKCQPLVGGLSWIHFVILMKIKNLNERKFYEIECAKNRWSKRDLERQIKTGYYQRVLLGSKENIQTKTNQLSTIGNQIIEPRDILVDPIVLNFFKQKTNLKEKDIENGIIGHLKVFLLELGSGFKFIDNQYQFNISNKKYFVDLVFYNEVLKCYVLIELKSAPFYKDVIGQINTYLNYFKSNINKPGDNDPIGIVMCTDFEHIQVEYALGNISNQIFVTKYITHLPKKEDLERELLLVQKK